MDKISKVGVCEKGGIKYKEGDWTALATIFVSFEISIKIVTNSMAMHF